MSQQVKIVAPIQKKQNIQTKFIYKKNLFLLDITFIQDVLMSLLNYIYYKGRGQRDIATYRLNRPIS